MITKNEVKELIESKYTNFEFKEVNNDTWEISYIPFANDLRFLGRLLISAEKDYLRFYEITELRHIGNEYLIMPAQSRILPINEVNTLMLDLSLSFANINYNNLKIKYKLEKEKLKMDNMNEDFE